MPSGPFLIAILALIIGSGVGYFVQHVTVSIGYDDKWPDVPGWKRRALASSGAITAFVVGLYFLQRAPNFNPDQVIVDLWFWQTIASGGGGSLMDFLWSRMRKKVGM